MINRIHTIIKAIRRGEIVRKDRQRYSHLDKDAWVQVFPDGTPAQTMALQEIPPQHRSYEGGTNNENHWNTSQSPLLVRLSFLLGLT